MSLPSFGADLGSLVEKRTELIVSLYLEEARSKKEPPYTKREYEDVRKNLKRGKFVGVTPYHQRWEPNPNNTTLSLWG